MTIQQEQETFGSRASAIHFLPADGTPGRVSLIVRTYPPSKPFVSEDVPPWFRITVTNWGYELGLEQARLLRDALTEALNAANAGQILSDIIEPPHE